MAEQINPVPPKNVVALVGIETIRDKYGNVKRYAQTFLDNMLTWKHDHPQDKLVIVNALKFLKQSNPAEAVWNAACASFDKIDTIIYSGHSSPESLILFSHVRTELTLEQRYLRASFHYTAPYADNAEIFIYGCQAGGCKGQKLPDSLAQIIANKTGKTVWAYVSKSYQIEKPKNHYYQISDDKIGLVKFTKVVTNEVIA